MQVLPKEKKQDCSLRCERREMVVKAWQTVSLELFRNQSLPAKSATSPWSFGRATPVPHPLASQHEICKSIRNAPSQSLWMGAQCIRPLSKLQLTNSVGRPPARPGWPPFLLFPKADRS